MASLTIVNGDLAGQKLEIDKDEISMGRSVENSISLDDPAVSGKHCVVIRDGNKFTLRDLHSTNGTRLNSRNVSEVRLKPGDIIMVGAVEIKIEGAEIEVDPQAADIPSRSSTTPTVVVTPRTAPSVVSAPGFQAKKDNRVLWLVVIIACTIVVIGAMGFFLMKVLNK